MFRWGVKRRFNYSIVAIDIGLIREAKVGELATFRISQRARSAKHGRSEIVDLP